MPVLFQSTEPLPYGLCALCSSENTLSHLFQRVSQNTKHRTFPEEVCRTDQQGLKTQRETKRGQGEGAEVVKK